MYRVVTLLLLSFLVTGATAQEAATETPDEPGDGAAAELPAPSADEGDDESADQDEEPDIDDADLDEQTYEEDEDDFIPTEEIPADEPIAFPSNI